MASTDFMIEVKTGLWINKHKIIACQVVKATEENHWTSKVVVEYSVTLNEKKNITIHLKDDMEAHKYARELMNSVNI